MNSATSATGRQTSPIQRAWGQSATGVLEELETSRDGLSEQERKIRLEKFGPNELSQMQRRSWWSILVDQLKSVIILLLAVAAVVSLAFGDYVEAGAIVGVIVINTLIGFFTEWRAVRSMEALRQLENIQAVVMSEGQRLPIPAKALVPGDVVAVEEGGVIPADLRLIESSELELDESALTGESVPVAKQTEPISNDAPLAERTNMAYKGTGITRGSGFGVVVATAMDTQIGEIAGLVAGAEEQQTPLEDRLDELVKRLVWFILAVTILVTIAGVLGGRGLYLMIQTAVALAVAVIPEGLAIVATLALARGMWRMVAHNALVRRLSSVETLGSTNIICTDKTGTLTENRMRVRRIELADLSVDVDHDKDETQLRVDGKPVELKGILEETIRMAVLANTAELAGDEIETPTGDPMELALLELGRRLKMSRARLLESRPEQRLVSFSSDTKMMATIHALDDGMLRVAVKGAPESVIEVAKTYRDNGECRPLDDEGRQRWIERSEKAAGEGLRLLAIATKTVRDEQTDPYQDLELLGFVGLVDPARADAPGAIEQCRKAGIRVVMITGDHPETARYVARQIKLTDGDEPAVLDGSILEDPERLTDQERNEVLGTSIFARVSPRQKLNLIQLHQAAGRIVAMTGDGINDAPALKSADIGIAMGKRGTEVARDAADIILLDDAFPTIVMAIEQGRTIFNNIRTFVVYLISGNVGEILAVGVTAAAGLPLPLIPLQILYLNMINDVFPALALGVGPGSGHVMKEPPKDPEEPFLRRYDWGVIIGYGVVIGATITGAFMIAHFTYDKPYEDAITVSFLSLSLMRLLHVFNMRDPHSGFFNNEVVKNRWVWGAIALSLALLAIAIWFPPLASILGVAPPDATGWAIIGVASIIPLIIGQIFLVIQGNLKNAK